MSVIRISNHCTSPSNWKDRYGSNNPTLSLSRKEIRRYRGNYNGILTKYFKKSFYSFVIYDPKTDGSQQCGNVQEEGIFIKQNSYDANQMTDELLVALENKIKAIASNAIVENKAYEFDNKTNKRYITSQRNRLAERDLHGFIRECVNKNLKRYMKNSVLNENTKLRSKPKRIIRLTEGDLCNMVKNCINEALLLENRESKSIKQTEKIIVSLFQSKYGDRLNQTATDDQGQPILTQRGDKQTVLQYLERHVRTTFFHNNWANIKFEPGIARIAYGELGMQANEDQQSLNKLGSILKILSQAHSDEYDSNLNGMSFTDLDNRFGKDASNMGKEEQDKINNAEYKGNGNYTIVKINSFEETQPFYKYTNPNSRWCLTHMEDMFDTYTNNGNNTLYLRIRKDLKTLIRLKVRVAH